MPTIEVNGKVLETDEEGYLQNLSDWSPEVAEYMAKQDGLELTENHWEVINFLREYYEECARPDQGHRQEAGPRQGQQQVPLRAVPLRPGEAGVQIRRPAEADRLRLKTRNRAW